MDTTLHLGMGDGIHVWGGDRKVVDKIEFPWESEIPLTCRKCDRAKYAYALAREAYRLQKENEEIRGALRDAMRIGGERVSEAVRKWCGA
ncbi:MAG: hypothetical protein EOM03_19040 [Clostridia bacterium]|nr:hypothetical protein [Clostridia bacterium]